MKIQNSITPTGFDLQWEKVSSGTIPRSNDSAAPALSISDGNVTAGGNWNFRPVSGWTGWGGGYYQQELMEAKQVCLLCWQLKQHLRWEFMRIKKPCLLMCLWCKMWFNIYQKKNCLKETFTWEVWHFIKVLSKDTFTLKKCRFDSMVMSMNCRNSSPIDNTWFCCRGHSWNLRSHATHWTKESHKYTNLKWSVCEKVMSFPLGSQQEVSGFSRSRALMYMLYQHSLRKPGKYFLTYELNKPFQLEWIRCYSETQHSVLNGEWSVFIQHFSRLDDHSKQFAAVSCHRPIHTHTYNGKHFSPTVWTQSTFFLASSFNIYIYYLYSWSVLLTRSNCLAGSIANTLSTVYICNCMWLWPTTQVGVESLMTSAWLGISVSINYWRLSEWTVKTWEWTNRRWRSDTQQTSDRYSGGHPQCCLPQRGSLLCVCWLQPLWTLCCLYIFLISRCFTPLCHPLCSM